MDDILELVADAHQHFLADSQTKKWFLPNQHRKYEAEYCFKRDNNNIMEKMDDPERTPHGKRAYEDFIASLAKIQQLPPLPDISGQFAKDAKGIPEGRTIEDIAELAVWERLISERKNAETAYRWKERLNKRVEADVSKIADDPKPKDDQKITDNSGDRALNDPYIGSPAIRPQTKLLLSSPPQVPFSKSAAAMNVLHILLLLYTVGTQLFGVLMAVDSPYIFNRWIQMSTVECLWAAFLTKEAFFITVPALHILIIFIQTTISVICKIILKAANNPKSLTLTIEKGILPGIENSISGNGQAQLAIYESLFLYLSSTWRIVVLAQQIYVKEVNPSAKDWKATLTTTANMMYNLVLMVVVNNDANNNVRALAFSTAFSLFSLLTAMVATSEQIDTICGALKDVNENRLSKFELALLLVKLQEIMLDEDVQYLVTDHCDSKLLTCRYNFVEHFYSSENLKLIPDVERLPKEDPDVIDMSYVPPLPENLALKYGHDGLSEYGKNYKGDAKLYTTIKSGGSSLHDKTI